MDLTNLTHIDSHILLGIINEKLRHECQSIDDLVMTYEVNEVHLSVQLSQIGYHYDPLTNQFKPRNE
ncbi:MULTISPECIES: DUF4250 domain-containing protein [unclassified Vibrio]|uniref:DUF4250 domain-containing protein n=1 Tax=Vibrio sp. HB236076 TaxID=3232307 RepID=A0AB39HD92_9VIBR|nr:DUF4250 domain-containing protein [Vibrio sp. HB161653]MDP5253557.1 DUF4250 domain-containing protein [Vibrio sp. HB161653]